MVFRIEIFEDDVPQPRTVLDVHLRSEHDVLHVVKEVAVVLPVVPVLARAVSVIVKEEHLAVIFEEVVGIYRCTPFLRIVVDA